MKYEKLDDHRIIRRTGAGIWMKSNYRDIKYKNMRSKIIIRDLRMNLPLKYHLSEILYNFINYKRTLLFCYNQHLEIIDERY